MAQPTWVTNAGLIGTFNESAPITFTFVATPSDPSYNLKYTILNGEFPPATMPFVLNETTGVLTGTASQVAETVKYSFTIRVKEYNGTVYKNFNDRTFSMDIVGITEPTFVTPAGPLYTPYILDSTWDPFQIQISNPDPETTALISLISGSLPPGLFINENGLIQGYATPPIDSNLVPVTSTAYTFILQVTSESGFSQRQFSITVQNQELLPGYIGRPPVLMNTQPPSFNISITDADKPYYYVNGNLGVVSQNNYFIFKLIGNNFGQGALSYNLSVGSVLPPGLNENNLYTDDNVEIIIDPLNAGSGYIVGDSLEIPWFYIGGSNTLNSITCTVSQVGTGGKIVAVNNINGNNVDSSSSYSGVTIVGGSGSGAKCTVNKINASWITGTIGGTELINEYAFTYTAFNNLTGLYSDPASFTITVVSQVDNVPVDPTLTWTTDSYLGTINNGQLSTLYVAATSASNLPIVYELLSGSLPNNLTLLPNGLISGRVAFEPVSSITPQGETNEFIFTIQAVNPDYAEIYTVRSFTLNVYQKYTAPYYENLYIQGLLSESDREIVDNLLLNTLLMPTNYLYRPEDPYFGRAKSVVYQHMFGVPVSTVDAYNQAVQKNHYRRSILLGPLKTAVARNSNNEIIYEVVYSEIVDDLVNDKNQSISKQIGWPTPIPLMLNDDATNNTIIDTDMTYYDTNAIVKVVNTNVSSSTQVTLKWFTEDLQIGMNLVGPNVTNDGDGLPPKIVAVNTATNVITVNVPQTFLINDSIIFYDGAYTSLTPGYATTLYPNSLDNMRQQIMDTIGFLNDQTILPLWMQSQQLSGNVLGYTPCWVICYTKPGYSELIKNNIEENWTYKLNQINFEIDRFEVDKFLTWDYDPTTDTWGSLPSSSA